MRRVVRNLSQRYRLFHVCVTAAIHASKSGLGLLLPLYVCRDWAVSISMATRLMHETVSVQLEAKRAKGSKRTPI